MSNLTQQKVKQLFDYSTETGDLIWKRRDDAGPRWNTRWAGKIAGNLNQSNGYMRVSVDYRSYKTHRIIWLWVYGYFPKEDIDHINHVRHDNRLINLREASRAQNMQNSVKRDDNTSGIKGVSFDTRNANQGFAPWHAYINRDYRRYNLGHFWSFDIAVEARQKAETTLYGEFNSQKAV